MPETARRPAGAPADWPDFPPVAPLVVERALAPQEWPALDLTWRLVTPHVLDPALGHVISSLLVQPGAPGPVAVAYRHRFSRSHPYGWECGVYVFDVPVVAKGYERTRMSFSCIGHGIARTPEEAREQASRHVTDKHPDAGVPYAARFVFGSRLYR
ncbi:hypothetical protein ACFVV7_35535 [Streptomyces globisporus]|uniref:hypothetical protein n=1 Tax=Streptomyces globisporus TaxID=1908 RepID=UPI0036DD6C13